MNREDMDLVVNKPIDNSVGAVDDFSDSGIVDLWDYTPGLWKSRQSFNRRNQLLGH